MTMRLSVVLIVASCTSSSNLAPNIVITAIGPINQVCLNAVYAWKPLGFTVNNALTPECGTDWWQTGEVNCQRSLYVEVDPLLRAKTGTDALSTFETQTITIDVSVTQPFLLSTLCAHEFGHLLLQTTKHDTNGIMAATDNVLSAEDRQLACEAIDLCSSVE